MPKCTAVKLVRTDVTIGDLLTVSFDDGVTAYWFYSQAEALQFVDKDVIVEFRRDILDGVVQNFIKTFTIPTVVNTISKDTEIKLFVDQVDNHANVSFTEIANGESRKGSIVFCSSMKFKSSTAARWYELVIRDKSMHTAVLRIFDPEEGDEPALQGRYIMAELHRTEYGFESKIAVPLNTEVPLNPEIEIAKTFISNFFANNSVAIDYMNKTNIVKALEESVDYELGYGLMRLAMELALTDSFKNISHEVDLQSIGEALLCSRGFTTRDSVLSSYVNNVFIAQQFPWKNRALVLQLLDVEQSEILRERTVMRHIQNTISSILEFRKDPK